MLIDDFYAAESNRLARLKVFCEAAQLNFYAANEEICKVVNDSAYNNYLSPQEVQNRFIAAKNFDLDYGLDGPWFWDLVEYKRRNKK